LGALGMGDGLQSDIVVVAGCSSPSASSPAATISGTPGPAAVTINVTD
jgi:hypothetical protein